MSSKAGSSKSKKASTVAPGKRPRKLDFANYSEVEGEVPAANVHGVVCSVSPMKKSKKCEYFDGSLQNNMRFVGFSRRLQGELECFRSSRDVVELKDCGIKTARRGEKFEVMLKSGTKVLKSPEKVDLSNIPDSSSESPVVKISDMDGKDRFDCVTVRSKVKEVMEAEKLEDGSVKQDAVCVDSSGVLRITVWGDCVNKMKVNCSYSLKNFMVQEYLGTKYLTMGRSPKSEVVVVDDIGPVVTSMGDDFVVKREIQNAAVIGVDELEQHKSCLRCKGRVEPSGSGCIGRCSRSDCGMLQLYEECSSQWSAKLLLRSSETASLQCCCLSMANN